MTAAVDRVADGATRVVPFDPRRPGRLSDAHRQVLTLVGDAFVRRLTLTFAARLRAAVKVTPEETQQHTYGEILATLPDPTCLAVVGVPPLTGSAIVHVALPVALAAVDRLCGGPGDASQPERQPTELEWVLLDGLLNNILVDVAAAFQPLVTFTPSILRREHTPALLKAAVPAATFVVTRYQLEVGEVTGRLEIALPFNSLEPSLESFAGVPNIVPIGRGSGADIADALLDTSVEVTVQLGPVCLTSSEIVGLEVGDVITMRHATSNPLEVLAAGVPCLAALIGRRGKRLACQIVESVEERPR